MSRTNSATNGTLHDVVRRLYQGVL